MEWRCLWLVPSRKQSRKQWGGNIVDWFAFGLGATIAMLAAILVGLLRISGHADALQEAQQEAHEQGKQEGMVLGNKQHAEKRALWMTFNVNQRREINSLRDERDSLLQRNMRLVQECRELHTRLDLAHEAVGKGD